MIWDERGPAGIRGALHCACTGYFTVGANGINTVGANGINPNSLRESDSSDANFVFSSCDTKMAFQRTPTSRAT